nr:DUF3168 domain-containing protein [Fredinandcohnia onubensis]
MLETALWPLQQAIFRRLDSDTALKAKVTGILDDVEEGQVFPYVTIGEPTITPFETKTTHGEQATVVLHCWSQYAGKKEAYEILNLMLKAMTNAPLQVEGFSLFKTQLEQMNVIIDIDDVTKHGIMRLRFYINN